MTTTTNRIVKQNAIKELESQGMNVEINVTDNVGIIWINDIDVLIDEQLDLIREIGNIVRIDFNWKKVYVHLTPSAGVRA